MRIRFFALIAFAMASTAWADVATIQSMKSEAGCGTLEYDIESSSSSSGVTSESLRVFFDEFRIQATQPGIIKKGCKLNTVLRIPAGYRILPRGAYAEGSYNIQPQGSSKGTLAVTHQFMPTFRYSQRGNSRNPWSGMGDFTSRADLVETEYLPCANHETLVTMETRVDFRLSQTAGNPTLIELDAVRNEWQLKRCNNFFEGKVFRAYLKFGSSSTQALRFEPYENKARLIGDNSVQGSMSQVIYSEDGRQISGNFEFGGRRGQLAAEGVDTESGEFRGSLKGSDGTSGTFFGYYAE